MNATDLEGALVGVQRLLLLEHVRLAPLMVQPRVVVGIVVQVNFYLQVVRRAVTGMQGT